MLWFFVGNHYHCITTLCATSLATLVRSRVSRDASAVEVSFIVFGWFCILLIVLHTCRKLVTFDGGHNGVRQLPQHVCLEQISSRFIFLSRSKVVLGGVIHTFSSSVCLCDVRAARRVQNSWQQDWKTLCLRPIRCTRNFAPSQGCNVFFTTRREYIFWLRSSVLPTPGTPASQKPHKETSSIVDGDNMTDIFGY